MHVQKEHKMYPTKDVSVQHALKIHVTKLLALTALLVAGQATYAQAPAPTTAIALGKDVPELMQLLEQRKAVPDKQINMQGKQLQGAQLVKTDLRNVIFEGSDLSNANLSGAALDFDFGRVNLTNANFSNTNLSGIAFKYSNLTGVNFTDANLTRVAFLDVILTNVNFSDANLTGSIFINCKGFETTIINNQTNFQDVDLTAEQTVYVRSKGAQNAPGKDMPRLITVLEQRKTAPNTSINMQQADLRAVDLRGANLKGANLKGAKLGWTNLTSADLTNADLTDADLTGTDLTNANLTNTNLTNLRISFAAETGTNFTNSKGFNSTIINDITDFQKAIGLTPEQKTYARSKEAMNIPN